MFISHLIALYFLLICKQSVQFSPINNNNKLTTNCSSPSGVKCKCTLNLIKVEDVQDVIITLSSCHSKRQWSGWSKWSKCKNSVEKRRRSCVASINTGPPCTGQALQVRSCTEAPANGIPEFVWGLWSGWNEWTSCNCTTKTKKRIRQCLSKSCEGCHVETVDCQAGCPTVRKWSEWTEWAQNNGTETRIRVGVTVVDAKNIAFQWKSEDRSRILQSHEWSDWTIQRTVAIRYRNLSNGTTQVDHRLIATRPRTSVSLQFCLLSSVLFLLIGLSANFIVQQIFKYISCSNGE